MVGNLNEIQVLIDRRETALTEVALNFWRAELNGPPHSHTSKEQVFYVTQGEGSIHIDQTPHSVKPGALLYIPSGVIHQSVTHHSSLTYFLFNAFLDPGKEGYASYAEHIKHVKAIRQRQADTGKATADPNLSDHVSSRSPLFIEDARGTTSVILIPQSGTDGCEVERIHLRISHTRRLKYGDREQTLFVISGNGTIGIDSEKCEVEAGSVIFVPMNASQWITAGTADLTYLSLSTLALPPTNNETQRI